MKKFLQFSGIIAAVLAIVAFILLMATPAIMSGNDVVAKGLTVIFGKTESTSTIIGTFTSETKLAWSGLLAWLFVLIAMLILLAGVILPLLKVKALEKFAGILNLVAICLLVVAGIFAFISLAVFCSANGLKNVPEQWTLSAGWVIAGILAIAGGVIAILPAAMDLIGKKK